MSRSALGSGLAAGLAVGTVVGAPGGDPVADPARSGPVPAVTRSVTNQPDHRAGDDAHCRHLFERPWAAATAERTTTDQVVTVHRTPDGATLRQSLTPLGAADAMAAMDHLTTRYRRCESFSATGDDGRAVTVRIHRREQLSVGGGGGWSVLLSVTDGTAAGAAPLSGYLAVVRLDGLLATVRHLGPIGTVAPADASVVAARAVGKVDSTAAPVTPVAYRDWS